MFGLALISACFEDCAHMLLVGRVLYLALAVLPQQTRRDGKGVRIAMKRARLESFILGERNC